MYYKFESKELKNRWYEAISLLDEVFSFDDDYSDFEELDEESQSIEDYEEFSLLTKAYHKGSCVNRTQAPLFLKPGTFDGFSKGIHTFATG